MSACLSVQYYSSAFTSIVSLKIIKEKSKAKLSSRQRVMAMPCFCVQNIFHTISSPFQQSKKWERYFSLFEMLTQKATHTCLLFCVYPSTIWWISYTWAKNPFPLSPAMPVCIHVSITFCFILIILSLCVE